MIDKTSAATNAALVNQINKQGVTPTGQTPGATGPGASLQQGPVPDAGQVALAKSLMVQSIMTSISMLADAAGAMSSDPEVDLLEAESKLSKMMQAVDNGQVTSDMNQQRSAIGLKEKMLQDAQQKIQDAQDKMDHLSVWDKVKLAFQWIGAALSIAVGALLIATGAGAAIGALMIVGGLVGIVEAVDSTMKACSPDGLGIAGQCAKDRGEPLDQCKKADQICGYVLMGVSVALALASLVGGIASAVSAATSAAAVTEEAVNETMDITTTATEVAESPVTEEAVNDTLDITSETTESPVTEEGVNGTLDISSDASKTASTAGKTTTTAQKALKASEAVDATTKIAEGAGSITAAVYQKGATDEQSQGIKEKADATAMDAFLQSIQDIIDQVINNMKNHADMYTQAVGNTMDAMAARADAVSRVKFG